MRLMASLKNITRQRFWEQECRCIWCGTETWCRTITHYREAAKRMGIPAGAPGSKKAMRRKMATAEHILPKSLGGTNAHVNIVMACARCNHRRSSTTTLLTPHPEVITTLPQEVQDRIRAFSK